MVITFAQPTMGSCEDIKVRTLPDCMLEELAEQSKVDLIVEKNYRRCKAIGVLVYDNELWRCVQKGGACDDAEEIIIGARNSTDVKIARAAFEAISELKKWDDGHSRLEGCYSVDGVEVEEPTPISKNAIFKSMKPPEQFGKAWIDCGYTDVSGNWSVWNVHLQMDKLMYTFEIDQ